MISKALINSYINHDEFISVNNMLREYNEMKGENKNPENAVEYTIQKPWKCIVSVVRKILRVDILVLEKLNKTEEYFYQNVLFVV